MPLPHIPDVPTERDASAILAFMERGIHYFEQGPPEPVSPDVELPFANGMSHQLIPVIGITWSSGHPDLATVYIDGKPHVFRYDWIGGQQRWLNR